eukprot:CAMPEP_0113937518 /NCGR_PEP_ID=MMETSP1339-20121228/4127_1 /TAXON_ID=94617 /ORGANISM="Fibrocapsa japonica" /LENGTH=109 /DNA_ID=CAMNT_0000940317 /DNA_START=199 /DNA_END=528 /DNA_ORIENTATION=- /assembly_acc=CAM_ASM_000762
MPMPGKALQVASTRPVAANMVMTEDMSWTGNAPPSKVLGPFLSKIPSTILAPTSLIMFGFGTYCIHASNIINNLMGDGVLHPELILGSTLVPISWGAHVACWIQKENGN